MNRHFKWAGLRDGKMSWTCPAPGARAGSEGVWAKLSAEEMGLIGGELSNAMVKAATEFIARKAVDGVEQAFQKTIEGTVQPELPS